MTKKDLLKQLGWSDKLISEFDEMAQPMRERSQKINTSIKSKELMSYTTTSSIYVNNDNIGSIVKYK